MPAPLPSHRADPVRSALRLLSTPAGFASVKASAELRLSLAKPVESTLPAAPDAARLRAAEQVEALSIYLADRDPEFHDWLVGDLQAHADVLGANSLEDATRIAGLILGRAVECPEWAREVVR